MTEATPAAAAKPDVLADVREVFGMYQKLIKINPKQDPGFVIKHLTKIFGEEADKNHDRSYSINSSILDNIRVVFEVYISLSKFDPEGAPGVLIQNLKAILGSETRPPEKNDRPGPKSSKQLTPVEREDELILGNLFDKEEDGQYEDNYDDDLFPVKFDTDSLMEMEDTEALEFLDAEEESEELSNQDLMPCRIVKVISHSQNQQPEARQKISNGLQNPVKATTTTTTTAINAVPFACSFCKRSFAQLRPKLFHERVCPQKLKLQSKPRKQPKLSLSNNTHDLTIATKTVVKSSKPYNIVKNLDVARTISVATQNTLISSGADLAQLTGRTGKLNNYPCHMCDRKIFSSRAHLANHIRTHTGERPFICPHDKCQRATSDSFNFRRHLKLPHANGHLLSRNDKNGLNYSDLSIDYVPNIQNSSMESQELDSLQNLKMICSELPQNYDEEEEEEDDESIEQPHSSSSISTKPTAPSKRGPRRPKRRSTKLVVEASPPTLSREVEFESQNNSNFLLGKVKSEESIPDLLSYNSDLEYEDDPPLKQGLRSRSLKTRGKTHRIAHETLLHTQEDLLFCNVCGRGCLDQKSLDEHHLIHTSKTPYPCRYCPIQFNNRGTRSRHEGQHLMKSV